MKFVAPGEFRVPATSPKTSPGAITLIGLIHSANFAIVSTDNPAGYISGVVPCSACSCGYAPFPMTRTHKCQPQAGFDNIRAVVAVSVNTAMARIFKSCAACAIDSQIVQPRTGARLRDALLHGCCELRPRSPRQFAPSSRLPPVDTFPLAVA